MLSWIRFDMRTTLIWRTIFVFSLIILMVLALIPMSGKPSFSGQDKVLHLLAFAGLFVLGFCSFPSRSSWPYLYLGLLLFGVCMEVLQGQTSYRSMEGWDLVADLLGIVLGHQLVRFFINRYPVRY